MTSVINVNVALVFELNILTHSKIVMITKDIIIIAISCPIAIQSAIPIYLKHLMLAGTISMPKQNMPTAQLLTLLLY